MTDTILAPAHASSHSLILHALGQSDEEMIAHLESCEACRARADSYQVIVAATRKTLGASSVNINVVTLEESIVLESTECNLGDAQHTLRVTLSAQQDVLYGRLTVDETCTCWQDAPVRLFGRRGLAASGRVDANREFRLAVPDMGQRYSLGLVLTRHDTPDLQIIGSFQIRDTTAGRLPDQTDSPATASDPEGESLNEDLR